MKIIYLNERFSRSLVAGFFTSLILLALNLFSYYILQVSQRRFINYSALMIFGREFNSLPEAIISSIGQITFSTSLFIIFSYLILKKNRESYLLRGLFIGLGSWFAIMSLAYIIGIHKILSVDVGSAASFLIVSIIWGISSAWYLHILDERHDPEEGKTRQNTAASRH